jgi:hypothetical protein
MAGHTVQLAPDLTRALTRDLTRDLTRAAASFTPH